MLSLIIKIVLATAVLLTTFFVSMPGLTEIAGEEGKTRAVRLWIVVDGLSSWVEHRGSSSFWIKQLVENPELKLKRDGVTTMCHARADLKSHALVYPRLNEQYGLRDSIIRMLAAAIGVPASLFV